MAQYWLLSAGKDGELWPTFWQEGKIAIGWSALGDLRKFASQDDLRNAYNTTWPGEKPRSVQTNVSRIWQFYQEVKQGDLVFVRSYTAVIGIAVVTSDYQYLGPNDALRAKFYSACFDDSFPHVRDVRWVSLGGGLKQPLTFTRLTVLDRPFPSEAADAALEATES